VLATHLSKFNVEFSAVANDFVVHLCSHSQEFSLE
jgi:hypothetical protein